MTLAPYDFATLAMVIYALAGLLCLGMRFVRFGVKP